MNTEDIKKQSVEIYKHLYTEARAGQPLNHDQLTRLKAACVEAAAKIMAAQIHVVGILEFENKLNRLLDTLKKPL